MSQLRPFPATEVTQGSRLEGRWQCPVSPFRPSVRDVIAGDRSRETVTRIALERLYHRMFLRKRLQKGGWDVSCSKIYLQARCRHITLYQEVPWEHHAAQHGKRAEKKFDLLKPSVLESSTPQNTLVSRYSSRNARFAGCRQRSIFEKYPFAKKKGGFSNFKDVPPIELRRCGT